MQGNTDTLKDMNFAQIEDQGFMPVYTRSKLYGWPADKSCGFRTDYQFITKAPWNNSERKQREVMLRKNVTNVKPLQRQ